MIRETRVYVAEDLQEMNKFMNEMRVKMTNEISVKVGKIIEEKEKEILDLRFQLESKEI